MLIQVISDTHLVHPDEEPLPLVGDVLVLAGDIVDTGESLAPLFQLARAYTAAGRPVLYVPGNHEFYGGVFERTLRRMHRECRQAGVTLLHNRRIELGGVEFYGSTLWTGYRLPAFSNQQANMEVASSYMPDHSLIYMEGGRRRLTPEDALRFYAKAKRMLEAYLASPKSGPRVIVTHHAPTVKGIARNYSSHPATPCFASNQEPVIGRHRPEAWIFGHTHYALDMMLLATRLVSNPKGHCPGSTFNQNFVIEI